MTNQVVDSSAIAVNRRQRRAQSDAWEVRQVLRLLRRYAHGERDGGRGVQGPCVAAEDQRQLPRDLETFKQERASTTPRIKGVLRSQGIRLTSLSTLPAQLDAVRRWEGSPLPSGLRRRGLRVEAPHALLRQQLAAVAAARRAVLHRSQDACIEQVRQLMSLRGLGSNGAWLLVMELFGWRDCKNRREVGGVAG